MPNFPLAPTTTLLPQMLVLAAITTLLLFSGSAIAQVVSPTCTQSSWNWVRNDNVSDPTCFRQLMTMSRHITLKIKIRAMLRDTCNPRAVGVVSILLGCAGIAISSLAEFTVPPLPPGYKYAGPSSFDGSNLCKCNTIVYSLLSACGACQGESWFTYDPSYLSKSSLMYLPSGGRDSQSTAQGLSLLPCAFPIAAKKPIH